MSGTDEMLIEVDAKDRIVGLIGRSEAHDRKSLKLHREVLLLLFTTPKRDRFLLQKRSLQKEQFPGYWTLSATGHINQQDEPLTSEGGYLYAARREAKEELAVRTKLLKLEKKIQHRDHINWAMMGIVTGELVGEVKINTKELSEVREFGRATIGEISGKLTPGARACLLELGII